MNLQINDVYIPGTVLRRDTMGNVTGMEFLKKNILHSGRHNAVADQGDIGH